MHKPSGNTAVATIRNSCARHLGYPSGRAAIAAWGLRRRFYRALQQAGLPRVRFHDLRHHFGYGAITKLDAYAVQSYMGYQHYSTTQRYLHHQPRREDANALAEAFGGGASLDVPDSSADPVQPSGTTRN